MSDLSPLVERVRSTVDWTVDTDEVAALLESGGLNDRVASREYGQPSVFTLAREVRGATPPVPFPPRAPQALHHTVIRDTAVRGALYLTPTVVAVGFAARLGALPWYATVGLLVAGWGGAQALAWLGYSVAGDAGPAAAARPLAAGFLAFAALWAGLLAAYGAGPRAYLVCAAQIALFAANTAALVTGRERATLAAALGCWLAVGAVTVGAPVPALVLLAGSLCAMVVVAYLPAVRPGNGWHWPDPGRLPTALRHGVVGAGQAVLFVLVVLRRADTVGTPLLAALPLFVGVPLAELTLAWHQRRVAELRRSLAHRPTFVRYLRRTGTRTALCLGIPLAVAAWPAAQVLLGRTPGRAQAIDAALLAGISGLCLVMVAHRRPLTAALLVWWPALLLAAALVAPTGLLPAVAAGTALADRVTTATLLCAYPPALALAALALRDPWSYR